MEIVAVPDAESVVHREDDEPTAREILIERVGVRVIVRVVPAEQHLPRWPTVDVDDGRLSRVPTARCFEQLPVDGQTVSRAKHDLFRRDQRSRKVGRNVIGADGTDRGARGAERQRRGQRGPLRRRADKDERRAVASNCRRPLEAAAGRHDLRRRTINRHANHVAPIDVERVRAHVARKHEPASVRTERDVLGHVAARSEEQSSAPRSRNRVEMRPPVLIRQKHHAVAGPPAEIRPAIRAGHGAAERLGRLPESLCCSGQSVGGPDLPGIGRPARRAVAGERGCEPRDRRAVVRVDADKGVIAAIGDEGEPGAVGRPARVRVLAACREQRLGGRRAVDRHGPDLAAFDKGHDIAAWGNHRLIPVGDRLGIAAVEGDAEDLHLRCGRVRADVHRKPVVPVRAVITAAHIHDPFSVRRDRNAAELLAVIAVVMRELARRERGAFGDEDVSAALLVERPCESAPGRGGRELVWERIRAHLIHGERRGPGRLGRRNGRRNKAQTSYRRDDGAHETPYSTWSTARNASCGISTVPTCFIRFLPSFCFSSNLRLRVTSPP